MILYLQPHFGYMDHMAKAAEKNPDTIFMHATGYKGNKKNMDNYSCMSYQARYLAGVAAGMLTKNWQNWYSWITSNSRNHS